MFLLPTLVTDVCISVCCVCVCKYVYVCVVYFVYVWVCCICVWACCAHIYGYVCAVHVCTCMSMCAEFTHVCCICAGVWVCMCCVHVCCILVCMYGNECVLYIYVCMSVLYMCVYVLCVWCMCAWVCVVCMWMSMCCICECVYSMCMSVYVLCMCLCDCVVRMMYIYVNEYVLHMWMCVVCVWVCMCCVCVYECVVRMMYICVNECFICVCVYASVWVCMCCVCVVYVFMCMWVCCAYDVYLSEWVCFVCVYACVWVCCVLCVWPSLSPPRLADLPWTPLGSAGLARGRGEPWRAPGRLLWPGCCPCPPGGHRFLILGHCVKSGVLWELSTKCWLSGGGGGRALAGFSRVLGAKVSSCTLPWFSWPYPPTFTFSGWRCYPSGPPSHSLPPAERRISPFLSPGCSSHPECWVLEAPTLFRMLLIKSSWLGREQRLRRARLRWPHHGKCPVGISPQSWGLPQCLFVTPCTHLHNQSFVLLRTSLSLILSFKRYSNPEFT